MPFNVTTSYAWLKADLAAATASGKLSIVMMHDWNEHGPAFTDRATFENAIKDQNIVAIFAGHIHQSAGRIADLHNGIRDIPVILSGSAECGTLIFADFQSDYFNFGVVDTRVVSVPPQFLERQRSDDRDLVDPTIPNPEAKDHLGFNKPIYLQDAIKSYSYALTAAPTQSPALNSTGFNNSDVTITWNWSATSVTASCPLTTTISAEGKGTLIPASCTDVLGRTGQASHAIYVDKTKPMIIAAATVAPNGAGGSYKTDVIVRFTCTDALSGIPAGTCPAD